MVFLTNSCWYLFLLNSNLIFLILLSSNSGEQMMTQSYDWIHRKDDIPVKDSNASKHFSISEHLVTIQHVQTFII